MPNLFSQELFQNLSRIKNIIETRQYCLHSCAMDAIINSDSRLSTTAGKLWTFLRTVVNSDAEWSIMISNNSLAKKIDRSAWTVRRLLTELEQCGYIYRKLNNGKMSKIYVRFPQEFLDKIEKETKPRDRSKCTTPRINPGGQKARSYYLYNTNNNNRDSTTVPAKQIESEIVVPATPVEPNTREVPGAAVETKPPKVNQQVEPNTQKIEKLEIRKKEVEKEFGNAINEKNYQKMRELGEIETSINREIDRLKSVPPPTKKIDSGFTKRKISEIGWNKIHKEINSYNLNINIQRLMEEMDFAVSEGSLRFSKFDGREMTVDHSWNIAKKLVKQGRWQKPRDMYAKNI